MNHFLNFFKVLAIAILVAGCQQQPSTPGSPSPAATGSTPAATTGGALEVKIAEGKARSHPPNS